MLVGQAAGWFRLEPTDTAIVVAPQQTLPQRCTIRPAAFFDHPRGFVEANVIMGRLVFARGATQPQSYRPFTHDPNRNLRELFFPIETMPADDWPASPLRWTNYQSVAKRLLAAVNVPWAALPPRDLDELVAHVPWHEPLEGCVLHALAQWTHTRGRCVIEIGSFRGRSLAMIALALGGVGSDSLLISIDPHLAYPLNAEHVRLTLRQIGQDARLVQFPCASDRAHSLLRRETASLIFIDGDHGYEQVIADFRNYLDLLAPGGCLLFHDYGFGNHNAQPDTDPGVRRAVDEHVFGRPDLRPLLLAHTLMAFVKPG